MARILVIDDDSALRNLLAEILVADGHEVSAAGSGEDGIARFREQFSDLVIADLLLPDTDGLETIQKLRSHQSDLRIIAISGAPPEWQALVKAEQLGAQKTLAKPFTAQELLAAVHSLLNSP